MKKTLKVLTSIFVLIAVCWQACAFATSMSVEVYETAPELMDFSLHLEKLLNYI